nr:hypothetical protein [uncultured Chitinophaga sp.]
MANAKKWGDTTALKMIAAHGKEEQSPARLFFRHGSLSAIPSRLHHR